MTNKTRKNKKEIESSSHHDNRGDIKIEKLIIKDDVGCITVNNSFEDNFKNYLKNETTAESRLKKKFRYYWERTYSRIRETFGAEISKSKR